MRACYSPVCTLSDRAPTPVQAKDAELATLRSLQAEPGRLQRPQRGRRVLKPEAPTTPAAVKQEVHFSHSAWLDLLRPG